MKNMKGNFFLLVIALILFAFLIPLNILAMNHSPVKALSGNTASNAENKEMTSIPTNSPNQTVATKSSVQVDQTKSNVTLALDHQTSPVAVTPVNQTSNGALTTQSIDFPAKGLPVLMYHSISYVPGNDLCVPPAQFADQMAWLHKQNYHTISMDQFFTALQGKSKLPEKPLLLTFDDGYADNYSSAWPILKQNGFRATFFIITGIMEMTWDQLRELAQAGNSIESHTVHHLDLATLSEAQQENELSQSKQTIEQQLGVSVEALCFPSGKYNDTTLSLMSRLGYKLGFTTHPGRVFKGNDLFTLKRVRISAGMSLTGFQKMFP